MVTGDEKWVTYDNIVRKRSWSKCGEAAKTVANPGLSARKVLLCIWWDCLDLALHNFLSDEKLGSSEDWENRLLEFFANEDQYFHERGIMKLILKWQQIIQQNGAYLTQIGQSEVC
ncbi:histone-lysine N-methyltransferase SETMAR-like [Trichonephila clavipes]|nr:histone-lysine N-methyltransferase SETMAR-like [Trichonephila clavipes]